MREITLEEIDRYISENSQDESAFVKPASSYLNAVIDQFYNKQANIGLPLPWDKFDGKFAIRPGEVTIWLGINGHGKSLVLGQVMNHMMLMGEKVCIASFEMRPEKTIQRMVKQAARRHEPSIDYIKAYHKWSDNRFWIYDQHGTTPPQRVLNLVRFAASIGIRQVVIDSLMKVIPNEDDYNGQKKFVDGLCVLARDTGMHVHLVHHSRKGDDESKEPGKMDAKGSGAITDLCDNCVSVWKRKDKSDKPDCVVKIDKQRHWDYEGRFGLWFDVDSQTFCNDESRVFRPIDVLRGEPCPI